MSEGTGFRESSSSDLASIERLYQEAFPDEDLMPLIRELLLGKANVHSLVGTVDTCLVGHAMFTLCGVGIGTDRVALLGPLAVARARQRRGIGRAIVHAGLQRLKSDGVIQVYVLGDPDYYGRLGFAPETDVVPPYALPAEWRRAWQAKRLRRADPPLRGRLSVPQPWLRPHLWAP